MRSAGEADRGHSHNRRSHVQSNGCASWSARVELAPRNRTRNRQLATPRNRIRARNRATSSMLNSLT